MKICFSCDERFESNNWKCPFCGWLPEEKRGFVSFAPELDGKDGDFSDRFFENFVKHEMGHFWFRARNEIITWALARYFQDAKSFLEIGCGTGIVIWSISRTFPEIRTSACDLFSHGLEYARSRATGVDFLQLDAWRLPFENEFDVVGAFDLLEHIEDDRSVLERMHGALKPKGGIIVTVPQHPALWSDSDDYSFHKRRYTRSELIEKARRAGFEPWKCN